MLLDYCRTDGCLVLVRSSSGTMCEGVVVPCTLRDSSQRAASFFHAHYVSFSSFVLMLIESDREDGINARRDVVHVSSVTIHSVYTRIPDVRPSFESTRRCYENISIANDESV